MVIDNYCVKNTLLKYDTKKSCRMATAFLMQRD